MSCMRIWNPRSLRTMSSESDKRGVTSNRSTVGHHAPQRFPKDPGTDQTMRLIESSGSLEFWAAEDEDVYSVEDGEPT